MSELHRITIDHAVCGGRPCLRGTRVRVKDVLDLLAAGGSREEILTDFPYLEAGDIVAALEYAARQSDHVALRLSECRWVAGRSDSESGRSKLADGAQAGFHLGPRDFQVVSGLQVQPILG